MNPTVGVVIAAALTAVGVVLGALFTRRSARDTLGLESLKAALGQNKADLDGLRERMSTRDARDREHMSWDRQLYDQALQAGWDVSPPPPLGG